MSKRFVIEGTWSGYRSGQQRIVHRQAYPSSRKQLREWAERVGGIAYTDGTFLWLSVRDCKPRERIQEIRGYSKLIEDCCFKNVSSVAAL